MRCIHCGNPLPEDSKFCQYCGEKLSPAEEKASEETVATVITEEKATVSVNETQRNLITESQKPISLSELKPRNEKKSNSKAFPVIPWVLFLLTAICFGVLLLHTLKIQDQIEIQNLEISELQTQVDELENTVTKQKSVIEDQTAKISTQREEYAEEKKKADMFDLLCSGLKSGKIGTGSEDFRVSDGVVILSKGTVKKIDLITSWDEDGGIIDFYTSNDCCTIDFTEDSWHNTTKLVIKGKSVGVTVATFYNSVNADTFKILVIVTE